MHTHTTHRRSERRREGQVEREGLVLFFRDVMQLRHPGERRRQSTAGKKEEGMLKRTLQTFENGSSCH